MHKNTKTKRKGGHEREQEKNKKLLSMIGQKCGKINSYFKGRYCNTYAELGKILF
jgi:hypothetical protein